MSTATRIDARAGFSLLEVLAVVLLTSIVIGAVLNHYVNINRASERATVQTERVRRSAAILDRVARGEEIVVTRHDKPVARIVPVGRPAREEVRAAVEGLRELRRAIAMRRGDQPALTADDIKSLIEEGRR